MFISIVQQVADYLPWSVWLGVVVAAAGAAIVSTNKGDQ